MATFILPSKLVAERVTVWFPFQAELNILEEVLTWTVEIETLVGIDPEPELLLYGVAALDGQEVSQQIHEGIPGVIYQLLCTITTSLGQTVQHKAKLAILPSPAIVPDIYGTRYSTPPYPLEIWQDTTVGVDFVTGRLRSMPFPVEYATHGIGFISGTMRDLLIRFTATQEQVTHGMDFIDGTLRDLLITFDAGEDSVISGINFISGTMEDKLLEYSTLPDQTTVGIQFISGTLI